MSVISLVISWILKEAKEIILKFINNNRDKITNFIINNLDNNLIITTKWANSLKDITYRN